MIGYVRGQVEYVEPEAGLVVVEAGGIGYNILVSGKEFSLLPGRGNEVRLHTYLQVREDAMQLFGFLSREDLQFFRLLIGVNGIGPKAALGILSVFGADELRFAILADDAKMISRAPGIGAKTARKLILELKDKLSLEDAFEKKLAHQQEDASLERTKGGSEDEAVQALMALGYSPSDALRAVRKVEGAADMDVEEILKAALKQMAFL
ncbi:MAG: Holliday junction branch migration protein RuvA [Lachnospiraceae bacterium]|nr:Holliday junction branch migration protein RuvA [Lachnospiraceae bacterium]